MGDDVRRRIARPPVGRTLAAWHRSLAARPLCGLARRGERGRRDGAQHSSRRFTYDKHPILARERVRGPLRETVTELRKIAKRSADKNGGQSLFKAILVPANDSPVEGMLVDLLDDETRLSEATIVLPPEAGGLDERGMLEGKEPRHVPDVADIPSSRPPQRRLKAILSFRRVRVLLTWRAGDERWSARRLGWDDDGNLDRAVAEARNHRDAAARVLGQFQRIVQKALVVLRARRGQRADQNFAAFGGKPRSGHGAGRSGRCRTVSGVGGAS